MRRKLEGKAYVEQYVQSLTHEMKSPLAAIRGAAELLQEPLPEADRRRFAHHIQDPGAASYRNHRQAAGTGRSGTAWLAAGTRAGELGGLLEHAAEGMSAKLAAAGLDLAMEVHDPTGGVQGDGYLLRQAVANLLDNAIAFSPAGGKVVSQCAMRPGNARRSRVADQRPAASPITRMERVFERFYSLARPGTGLRSSGLGLPFVREVARLHGGEADLRNLRKAGAVASLRLPMARARSAPARR